jgi:hypothetical protein
MDNKLLEYAAAAAAAASSEISFGMGAIASSAFQLSISADDEHLQMR